MVSEAAGLLIRQVLTEVLVDRLLAHLQTRVLRIVVRLADRAYQRQGAVHREVGPLGARGLLLPLGLAFVLLFLNRWHSLLLLLALLLECLAELVVLTAVVDPSDGVCGSDVLDGLAGLGAKLLVEIHRMRPITLIKRNRLLHLLRQVLVALPLRLRPSLNIRQRPYSFFRHLLIR